MENNDIRKEINEIDDNELDVVAGGAGADNLPRVGVTCPYCGVVGTVPKPAISAWMAAHLVCCDKNPCK